VIDGLDAAGSTRRFLAAEGPIFVRALKKLDDAFEPKKATKQEKQIHEAVVRPLRAALSTRWVPEISATWQHSDSQDGYLVRIGDQLFPFILRDFGGSNRELKVWPPRKASEVDVESFVASKDRWPLFYGTGGKEVPRLALEQSLEGAPKLAGKDGSKLSDEYVQALWDVSTRCHARATRLKEQARTPGAVEAARFVAMFDGKASKSEGPKAKTLLATLLRPRPKGVIDKGTPGPYLGHDLVFADSWNGIPIAVTSWLDFKHPVIAWAKIGEKWQQIPWPADADLAVMRRGVGAVLRKNSLNIAGGFDAKRELTPVHWAYDLASGYRRSDKPRFASEAWAPSIELDEAAAYVQLATHGDQLFAMQGVSEFFIPNGSKKRRALPRMRMDVVGRSGWVPMTAPPTDTTGGDLLSDEYGFFVGPGNKHDGRVYHYDTEEGRASASGQSKDAPIGWYSMPSLPDGLGQGQLLSIGSVIIYGGGTRRVGGKDVDNNELYAFDRDAFARTWKKIGTSDYLAGRARIVREGDHWLTIAMKPGLSRCYRLD
jgi:hypothetical protein